MENLEFNVGILCYTYEECKIATEYLHNKYCINKDEKDIISTLSCIKNGNYYPYIIFYDHNHDRTDGYQIESTIENNTKFKIFYTCNEFFDPHLSPYDFL